MNTGPDVQVVENFENAVFGRNIQMSGSPRRVDVPLRGLESAEVFSKTRHDPTALVRSRP